MAAERILDHALGHLFARALVAIARADDQIGLEAGLRLAQRIELRTGGPVRLDDLLLAEPLEPHRLGEALRQVPGPFRGAGVHPGELAVMIVTDGIAVVLAKNYVSEAEAGVIIRFAAALGSRSTRSARCAAASRPGSGRSPDRPRTGRHGTPSISRSARAGPGSTCRRRR